MNPDAPDHPAPPSRQGLAELVLLVAFLALASAGAVAVFGPELRQAFGGQPAPPTPTRAP